MKVTIHYMTPLYHNNNTDSLTHTHHTHTHTVSNNTLYYYYNNAYTLYTVHIHCDTIIIIKRYITISTCTSSNILGLLILKFLLRNFCFLIVRLKPLIVALIIFEGKYTLLRLKKLLSPKMSCYNNLYTCSNGKLTFQMF